MLSEKIFFSSRNFPVKLKISFSRRKNSFRAIENFLSQNFKFSRETFFDTNFMFEPWIIFQTLFFFKLVMNILLLQWKKTWFDTKAYENKLKLRSCSNLNFSRNEFKFFLDDGPGFAQNVWSFRKNRLDKSDHR